jgi:type I restriction enzyme S subunit
MSENQKIISTEVGKIPKDWTRYNLEEISEFITKGATPTTYGFKWEESGIPFLRSECVSENGFIENGLSFISEEANNAMNRSKVQSDDILISITGNVGRIAIYPKKYESGNINQHIARVRIIKEDIADRMFVYFQINQPSYRSYYNGIVTGAAYPQLSLKQIRETPVFLPPIPTQKRIASILSAYDDLIENNLKRIKILEETAQNIYKEWFVNFRFPNYENTPINQETGLPEGWEVKRISSIVEFKGGFPFKSSEYSENGKYRIITIKNVGDRFFDGNNTSGIENIPDKMKEYCKLQEGNILMSLTGNIGRTCLVYGDNYLLNQRVVIITPTNSENSAFCYFLFNTDSIKGLMNNLASGVAQQNLSPVKLQEQWIPLPTLSLMLQYSSSTNGIVNQIISLNKQNQKLKEARDILLPRLMNRTIEV